MFSAERFLTQRICVTSDVRWSVYKQLLTYLEFLYRLLKFYHLVLALLQHLLRVFQVVGKSIYNFIHAGDHVRFSASLSPIPVSWPNEQNSRSRSFSCRLMVKPPRSRRRPTN